MSPNQKRRFQPTNSIHKVIKLEDLTIRKLYAFSYNPTAQPKRGQLNSVKEWWDLHENLFCNVCKYSNYKLYCELSPKGRFHFHGWLTIENIVQFVLNDLQDLMLNAAIDIEHIQTNSQLFNNTDSIPPDETQMPPSPRGSEGWEIYVLKQQILMQEFLQKELYGPLVECPELINITTPQYHQV